VNGAGSFELAKMAVREDCRNQGIGRALLAHVIETARTLGVRQLTLETNRRLTNAIHLYESLGFQHVTALADETFTLYAGGCLYEDALVKETGY
jgi:GNAT superfamily N-acetyltransferase